MLLSSVLLVSKLTVSLSGNLWTCAFTICKPDILQQFKPIKITTITTPDTKSALPTVSSYILHLGQPAHQTPKGPASPVPFLSTFQPSLYHTGLLQFAKFPSARCYLYLNCASLPWSGNVWLLWPVGLPFLPHAPCYAGQIILQNKPGHIHFVWNTLWWLLTMGMNTY